MMKAAVLIGLIEFHNGYFGSSILQVMVVWQSEE